MENRINQALTKLFDRHRIVFWYDAKRDLRDEFEALELDGVEKLEIANNEFALKHRMLRDQPKQRFLLYHEGPQPDDLDNWLLDVLLAHAEFRADQTALWLADLELGHEFSDVVEAHAPFFQSGERPEALKPLLRPEDTASDIRLKMLAVCAGADPGLESTLEHLLQELAEDKQEKTTLIERCGLNEFLWKQVERRFGYQSAAPGIRDFAITLFKDGYFRHFPAPSPPSPAPLSPDARVFLKRWQNNRLFARDFAALSEQSAAVLGIEGDLEARSLGEIGELDFFRQIDKRIIGELSRSLAARTIAGSEAASLARQRRHSFWYGDFRHLYEAIEYAALFFDALREADLHMDGMADGVRKYSGAWFRIDQLYRKFSLHKRKGGETTVLKDLSDQVEQLYTNNFLLKLGDRFQVVVDAAPRWEAFPVRGQQEFFTHWVKPYPDRGNKVCVLISDALRYEIAEELMGRINREDRYNAELEPALAMLPSYTQLGMAALLPHKTLALAEDGSDGVLVDGQNSRGTANRAKILGQADGIRATARNAEELMDMSVAEGRALLRDHDVLYVYHNRIDAAGDKQATEEQVFEAAESTLDELVLLVKKLAGANANNVLVTADHGFLYQDTPIHESDFYGGDAADEGVMRRNRRFLLGKGLAETPGLHTFTSAQLGLAGDMEARIPKSVNRLRLKGSGSRYVHGGATLQEVVVPVLRINKKRRSDVSQVEVEILTGSGSRMITSGQLTIILYQSGPVTDKTRPRVLRAGIYSAGGELISDSRTLTFDSSSENARDREQRAQFMLTGKADAFDGQEVFLRLEEQHAGTSHYTEYKSLPYRLRRAFTSDFD